MKCLGAVVAEGGCRVRNLCGEKAGQYLSKAWDGETLSLLMKILVLLSDAVAELETCGKQRLVSICRENGRGKVLVCSPNCRCDPLSMAMLWQCQYLLLESDQDGIWNATKCW